MYRTRSMHPIGRRPVPVSHASLRTDPACNACPTRKESRPLAESFLYGIGCRCCRKTLIGLMTVKARFPNVRHEAVWFKSLPAGRQCIKISLTLRLEAGTRAGRTQPCKDIPPHPRRTPSRTEHSRHTSLQASCQGTPGEANDLVVSDIRALRSTASARLRRSAIPLLTFRSASGPLNL